MGIVFMPFKEWQEGWVGLKGQIRKSDSQKYKIQAPNCVIFLWFVWDIKRNMKYWAAAAKDNPAIMQALLQAVLQVWWSKECITVGWLLIVWFNDCVLGKSGISANPIIAMVDPYRTTVYVYAMLLIANIGKTCNLQLIGICKSWYTRKMTLSSRVSLCLWHQLQWSRNQSYTGV